MAAHDGKLVIGEAFQGRSLGQDLAQLDVVLLAASFLPGLQRVAVVDAAALPAVYARLDLLGVQELVAAVGEDDAEVLPELLFAAEYLDVVEDDETLLEVSKLFEKRLSDQFEIE